jgi:hypothetical protein
MVKGNTFQLKYKGKISYQYYQCITNNWARNVVWKRWYILSHYPLLCYQNKIYFVLKKRVKLPTNLRCLEYNTVRLRLFIQFRLINHCDQLVQETLLAQMLVPSL